MDPKKLLNIAKDLNTFMHDEGFMAEVSIKIIWERIMSCIAQGHQGEIKLAFPIRMELQNRIGKELPSKLGEFKKHVQDLDDEMNKMLTSPDLTYAEDEKEAKTNLTRGMSAKSVRNATEKPVKDNTKTADAISLRDEIESKDSRIETLQDRVSYLEEKLNTAENYKLTKATSEKIVQTESNETDLDKEIKSLKTKLKVKDDEIQKYKTDVDALQNRLSKLSSQALASGNEVIVDLSNENRPVKLWERYSELYDNEWTDAFEVLTSDLHYDDKAAIQKLIEILNNSYDFCEVIAQQQLQGIVERLVYPTDPEVNEDEEIRLDMVSYKTMCDLRRSAGKHSVAHLQTMFIKHMERKKPDLFTDETLAKVNPYIWKCVELCWFMVIQSPPIYINTKWQSIPGELFNNDMFKFYAETGDKMDYVVWPTLFLKEGGPVLCKGVAQPRGIL